MRDVPSSKQQHPIIQIYMYTRGNIHIHLGNSGMYPGYPLTTLTGAKKIPLTLAGNTKAIPVCSGIEIPIDIHIIIPAGIIFSAECGITTRGIMLRARCVTSYRTRNTVVVVVVVVLLAVAVTFPTLQ